MVVWGQGRWSVPADQRAGMMCTKFVQVKRTAVYFVL